MSTPRLHLTVAFAVNGGVEALYLGGDPIAAETAFADAELDEKTACVQLFKFLEPHRRKNSGAAIVIERSAERTAAMDAAAKDTAPTTAQQAAALAAGVADATRNLALRAGARARAARDAGTADEDALKNQSTAAAAAAASAAAKSKTAAKNVKPRP